MINHKRNRKHIFPIEMHKYGMMNLNHSNIPPRNTYQRVVDGAALWFSFQRQLFCIKMIFSNAASSLTVASTYLQCFMRPYRKTINLASG